MEHVMLTLTPELLSALDVQARRMGKKRSQAVREAVGQWVAEREKEEYEALLAQGYQEMAEHLTELASESEAIHPAATESLWRWDE